MTCRWLHSPKQASFNGSTVREPWLFQTLQKGLAGQFSLQWVHGPRTVVIRTCPGGLSWRDRSCASMGPRSENRGYEEMRAARLPCLPASMGPRSENRGYEEKPTVGDTFFAASMGPRSENRGYLALVASDLPLQSWLQWVHGPRTVVIHFALCREQSEVCASMGPRSENRGYLILRHGGGREAARFNGSTVREPWLCDYRG